MQWFVDHFDKGIPFTNIGMAVSWQLVERGKSCFFSGRLQGAIESSTLAKLIDR